jgi:hypothetical protein
MSDESMPQAHPFEVLAPYVDGSADDADRVAAEAHLQTCETCRRDVALAASARSALRTLPDVEAPPIAAAVASTLGLDERREEVVGDGAVVVDMDQRRARRWQAVWGAGLAAAAIVAGVLIYMGVVSGGSPGGGQTAASAPRDAAGSAVTLTPASVDQLARELAGLAGGAATAPPAFSGAPERAPQLSGADAATAEACVRSAGGVDPAATATEVFAATFQDTPAFVGAFESGNQVQVIVATRDGCQPLYTAAARKG